MLIHSRKRNESSIVETSLGTIEIKVLRIDRGVVKLGFDAPIQISIHRDNAKNKTPFGRDVAIKDSSIDITQWDIYQAERRRLLTNKQRDEEDLRINDPRKELA